MVGLHFVLTLKHTTRKGAIIWGSKNLAPEMYVDCDGQMARHISNHAAPETIGGGDYNDWSN